MSQEHMWLATRHNNCDRLLHQLQAEVACLNEQVTMTVNRMRCAALEQRLITCRPARMLPLPLRSTSLVRWRACRQTSRVSHCMHAFSTPAGRAGLQECCLFCLAAAVHWSSSPRSLHVHQCIQCSADAAQQRSFLQRHTGSRLFRLPARCCSPEAEPARRASQHWGRQQRHPGPSAGLRQWQLQSSAARPQSRHQCGSGPHPLPARRPCSGSGRLRRSSRGGSLGHSSLRPSARKLAPAA